MQEMRYACMYLCVHIYIYIYTHTHTYDAFVIVKQAKCDSHIKHADGKFIRILCMYICMYVSNGKSEELHACI